MPIVRVSVSLPKYRLENGRTSSLQAEYLATTDKVRPDLFTGDPELWDAQIAQHALLLKLSHEAGLRAKFEQPGNIQVEPILVSEHGVVVNGNRRLAMWRELHYQDAVKYAHFGHIDVAVLSHCDEREIDKLEATLQIEEDIKADYEWHAEANMMRAKQKQHGFSNKELSELYKRKEAQIDELFDMRAYAEEYLASRKKRDHWSLVNGAEFAFRSLVRSRKGVQDAAKQELLRHLAFALIDKSDELGGRVYAIIPELADALPETTEALAKEFAVSKAPSEDESLDGLFGGGDPVSSGLELQITKVLESDANRDAARAVVLDIIEARKLIKKNSREAEYLLECCTKAHALLNAAAGRGLRPESVRDGVGKQLDEIDGLSRMIRDWLNKHA